jgi:hypothetical protein
MLIHYLFASENVVEPPASIESESVSMVSDVPLNKII